MINKSRRQLLKGMGYGMAAVATGGAASSTVMAATATASSEAAINQSMQFVLPSCDVTIYLQQSVGKEIVSLMNLTDKPVTLDSIKPVGLKHVNGSLVVKLTLGPLLAPRHRGVMEAYAHMAVKRGLTLAEAAKVRVEYIEQQLAHPEQPASCVKSKEGSVCQMVPPIQPRRNGNLCSTSWHKQMVALVTKSFYKMRVRDDLALCDYIYYILLKSTREWRSYSTT